MALDVCQAASPSLSHTSMLPSLSISAATPACLIIVWQLEVPLHVAAAPLLPSFLCASFDAGYKFQMNLTTTLKTNQRKPQLNSDNNNEH